MSGIYQPPQPYINGCTPPDNAQTGAVYYDSGLQSMVVYDGTGWRSLALPRPVLTADAQDAIDHVISSLKEQNALYALADKYPLVASAIGQLEVALKMSQNINNE
jgi:hypothetical protein|tara:strand:- start:426 stop:740 length:315 start_codon:yes stop_codon:yes gene_type:complete